MALLVISLLGAGAAAEISPSQEPVATAIRAILEAGQHPMLHRSDFSDRQQAAMQLYEAVQFRPLWLRGGQPTPQALEILRTLAEADRRGLSPDDYDATRLAQEVSRFESPAPPGAEDCGAFDTALTVSVLRYVSDAHVGRVPPSAAGFALEAEPRQFDATAFVAQLPEADAPAQLLAALDPPFALFGRFLTALAYWRSLAARTDVPQVPNLPKLHPGEADAGVVLLRDFLRALGDLPDTARRPKDARVYDSELVKAVKRFQERQGLGADGVIGEKTLNQLQVSPAGRVRQIELALERVRWLPPPEDDTFIVVNLPEFQLRGFHRGNSTPVLQLRAVVGAATLRRQTPVLHATMQYLVFRPYWDVPASIARKEILPEAAKDPGYFSQHNYEFHNGRIRQLPGEENALGLLKFVFPNPFHVYMHDTPTKKLFARSRRAFSHGCIRVSDAAALAEFVLSGQGKWDREAIEAAMKGGRDNARVYLERPVGVYLLYSTVVVDEDGTTHFFEDIYGHDARLQEVLEKARAPLYPKLAPRSVKLEQELE